MAEADLVEIPAGIARDDANAAEDRINAILTLREIQDEGKRPTPGQ